MEIIWNKSSWYAAAVFDERRLVCPRSAIDALQFSLCVRGSLPWVARRGWNRRGARFTPLSNARLLRRNAITASNTARTRRAPRADSCTTPKIPFDRRGLERHVPMSHMNHRQHRTTDQSPALFDDNTGRVGIFDAGWFGNFMHLEC